MNHERITCPRCTLAFLVSPVDWGTFQREETCPYCAQIVSVSVDEAMIVIVEATP